MNARDFAALAISASLLLLAGPPSQAAEGPLAQFAGNWAGTGKITVDNGSSERIRCRSTNVSTGNSLTLALRCASDSYKFELSSDIAYDGGNISGSWNENTRGVFGKLSGKANAGNIQALASAVGFNASLSIRAASGSQSVLIKSPGSEISEVAITMARGAAR